MDRSSFAQSMLAFVLTPVNSAGDPISINPVNGLPSLQYRPGQTTTFAVVGPMSGPDAQIGQQMVNGARAAIDYANSRPAGALDRAFALVTFDDQDQPIQSALSASFAMNDGNVIAVVGHFTGANTDAALHTYVSAQLPLVVPATTTDSVTSHGYRNVFRLPTRDGVEGALTARYLQKNLHPKRCTVVTREHAYGGDVGRTFAQQMRNEKVDTNEVVLLADDVDALRAAARIIASGADLVYFAGKVGDLGAVFDRIGQTAPSIHLTASQGFFAERTVKDFAKTAEGIVVSTSIPPMNQVVTNRVIVSDFAARYGSFTNIAGFAYASMQILIAAARRSGAINRPAMVRALSDGSTYQTIAGDFRFSPFGDHVDPNVYFYTIRKGEWEYLESYRPSSFAINKG